MSILRNTNSGLFSLPLTPDTAKALGWRIEKEDGQGERTDGFGHKKPSWKCINMVRDDICAPIQFWYEPKDKLKYCNTQSYFFADDEFGLHEMSSRNRHVTTVRELAGYLEFLRQAEKHGNEMKSLWDKYMKNLKDPNEKYYE